MRTLADDHALEPALVQFPQRTQPSA